MANSELFYHRLQYYMFKFLGYILLVQILPFTYILQFKLNQWTAMVTNDSPRESYCIVVVGPEPS